MLAVPIEYWRPANHASLHLLGQPCIAYIAAAGKWIAGGIGTCLHLCSVCIFVFQSSLKPYQQVLAGEGRAYRIFYGSSAKETRPHTVTKIAQYGPGGNVRGLPNPDPKAQRPYT